MKRIGIFGTSGFARETADVAIESGYVPTFIARDAAERDAWAFDGQVVVESDLAALGADIAFAIGIGENAVRQRVWERHRALRFVSLIHPAATMGAGQRTIVEAQIGVIVCAGVRLTNHIEIGKFAILNINATVGHDAVIGAFANISPGANVSGNVDIGERCWVGTGAAVNQGHAGGKLVIGHDTVVGSGSVVVRNCEPESVYVGIPARKIK